MKRILLMTVLTLLLGAWLVVGAQAQSVDVDALEYTIKNDQVTITDCDTSVAGELVIPDTIEGYPVTSIGSSAFSGCSKLTSITIPDSVTEIGWYALDGCNRLESVTIPFIGDKAQDGEYYNFSYLFGELGVSHTAKKADVPASLKTVILSDACQYISNYAFYRCKTIENVVIGRSVKGIAYEAFFECGLTSITIPGNVKSIGSAVFRDCAALKTVVLEEGVEYIGKFAFEDCAWLNTIAIPDSVTYMGEKMLNRCNRVENLTFARLGQGTYLGKDEYDDEGADILQELFAGDWFLPDSLKTVTVTDELGANAFSSCYKLTSVTLGDGITTIPDRAFYGCKALTQMPMSDKMTAIGDAAFSGCTSLTDIVIGKNVKTIGEEAFYGCEMTSVVIPNGVTHIGDSAFYMCQNLKSITLPDSLVSVGPNTFWNTAFQQDETNWVDDVLYIDNHLISVGDIEGTYTVKSGTKSIASHAFFRCDKLTKVVLPNGLLTISDSAFDECTALTNVTIPDSVVTIGEFAFAECEALTDMVIPNNVTTIGKQAFWYCSSLETVSIPASVTSMGGGVFSGCESLISITVDPGNTVYCSVEGVLYDKAMTTLMRYPRQKKDTWFVIPAGVTNINDGAFAYFSNLVNLTIPKSLTRVGSSAFNHTFWTLKHIWYVGSESDRENLVIEQNNLPLTSATWHYNACQDHTYDNAVDADCNVCGIKRDITYTGWLQQGGKWYYYQNGKLLKNKWQLDSTGWCYLGSDGAMKTNAWIQDSVGWCYVDGSGYIVKSNWVQDGGKWYYLNKDGYMLSNTWQLDSIGWCYLGADGAMKTNSWIKDSQGWCYVGADGYCVTDKWMKDSVGWVYLDHNGRMVTNAWVQDSVGWCYVGADGYAVTNCWKKDSVGWCYLNANGSMMKNEWLYDGGLWYYLDANGYMVTGTRTIGGKPYTFNASGVWVA